MPVRDVWAYIRTNLRTFLCHNLGIAFLALAAYGGAAMIPELVATKHHWTMSRVGFVFGMISMVFGSSGILLGGRLADWLRGKGHTDATLRVALLGAVAWLPFGFYPLMPTGEAVMALVAVAFFFSSMAFGVGPAAIQEMVPNTMRGQASAIYLFVINLIGLGCGPTAVALVTDKVFRNDDRLDISLAIVCVLAHFLAVALLWSGLKPYRRSLDSLTSWNGARS
jgi:hypothetical protein